MIIFDQNRVQEKELMPGLHAKLLHSERMSMVFWRIEKDALLPEHYHPHEQIATVTKGELQLTVDGKTQELSAGMSVTIPGDAVHSGLAITDCEVIDCFAPVREDLIKAP